MNHLFRDLAPISEAAWSEIEAEAKVQLTHFMAARKLVDFVGPCGWDHSAVSLGRVGKSDGSQFAGVTAAQRQVLPMVELHRPLVLKRSELEEVDRGASDADLQPLDEACRDLAIAEDQLVFDGYPAAGITGIASASPHTPLELDEDFNRYPNHVAQAVSVLKNAGVAGPYAIALGPRCYRGVIETTERGGYPTLEHLRLILGGPVIWAPAVDGAIVISQRGGDFTLTVGQDPSIAYKSHDAESVTLELQESVAFQAVGPEAAIAMRYPD